MDVVFSLKQFEFRNIWLILCYLVFCRFLTLFHRRIFRKRLLHFFFIDKFYRFVVWVIIDVDRDPPNTGCFFNRLHTEIVWGKFRMHRSMLWRVHFNRFRIILNFLKSRSLVIIVLARLQLRENDLGFGHGPSNNLLLILSPNLRIWLFVTLYFIMFDNIRINLEVTKLFKMIWTNRVVSRIRLFTRIA